MQKNEEKTLKNGINYRKNIQFQVRLIQTAENEATQCKRVKMLERMTKPLHDEQCKKKLEEIEEEYEEGRAKAKEPTGYDDSKLWSIQYDKTMEKIPVIVSCLRRQDMLEEKKNVKNI